MRKPRITLNKPITVKTTPGRSKVTLRSGLAGVGTRKEPAKITTHRQAIAANA
ncbi:hypothetical protein D3C73_1384070 [compost metagenome]